jgi:REP element-mobilizing transposase RayT
MPRTARLDIPGLLQHVIVRGINKSEIFLDDQDRILFPKRLSELLTEMETACYAWALLPNHFHLLLKPTRYPLASFMRRLLTSYAVTFNLRHERTGHLFQNRYKSIVCEEEPYLLELIRYIHLNPLRAGLVKDIDELDRYPWCGHSVLMGNYKMEGQEVRKVLILFGDRPQKARESYRRFLGMAEPKARRDDLVGGGLKRSQTIRGPRSALENFDARVLGSGDFVEELWEEEAFQGKFKKVLPLATLIERVASFFQLNVEEILSPSKIRLRSDARGIVCYLAARELGYRGFEIGKDLRMGPAGVSIGIKRGERLFKERVSIKKEILKIIEK